MDSLALATASMPTSISLAAAYQSSVSCATRKPLAEAAGCTELGRRVRRCLERLLQPADALAKLALRPPENVQARGQLERSSWIDLEQTRQRDARVVLDATEHLEVWPLRTGERPRALVKSGGEVEARVTFTNRVDFSGGAELFEGVTAGSSSSS